MTREEQIKAVEGIIEDIVGEIIWSGANAHNCFKKSKIIKTKKVNQLATAIVDAIGLDEEKIAITFCPVFFGGKYLDVNKEQREFTDNIANKLSQSKDIIKIEVKNETNTTDTNK